MDVNRRGYWGVLPGEIKRDTELTIAARYLYIILSSMAYEDGYCWPSNEYLAEEIGLSKRRVVELLAQLREKGYIRIAMRPCETSHTGEQRYIYCGMFPDRAEGGCEIPQGEGAENRAGGCEISQGEGAKNTFPYKGRKTNKKYIPLPPCANDPEWVLFNRFWAAYPRKQNKERARQAWRKLNPDLELCRTMAAALERDKQSMEWRKENGAYIPHPSSWLNGLRWEDEHEPPSPPSGGWAPDPEAQSL